MELHSVNHCMEQLHYWLEQVEIAAELQGITEHSYDKLVVIAKAGIVLVNQLQEGDCVTREWVVERDILVHAAAAIIEDTPTKKERRA